MTLRVLALCGFSQNASVFAKQVSAAFLGATNPSKAGIEYVAEWSALPPRFKALQVRRDGSPLAADDPSPGTVKVTHDGVQFVFLDPPVLLPLEQLNPFHRRSLSIYTDADPAPPVQVPRAWWASALVRGKKRYQKYDDTVKYLHEFLSTYGPFDGIIGFSQGCGMASVLTALCEKPGLHPGFAPHERIQPFKFFIGIGGFVPRSEVPDFKSYFPISTPVLAVAGTNDPVVPIEESRGLLTATTGGARLEIHDGGHWTPATPEWKAFFSEYITTVGEGGDPESVPPLASFVEPSARL